MLRPAENECVNHPEVRLRSSSRLLRRIGIVVLLLYLGFFVIRRSPPHLAQWFFCDFANFYSGARVWVQGGDPYRIDQVYRTWHDSGHGKWLSIPDLEAQDIWAGVYPPPTLAALAPIAALRAVPAHLLWLGLNLVVFVAACLALWSIGGIRGWEQRLLVGLLVFASSAGISTFGSGQLALFAGCLIILATWAVRKSRRITAGLLIGLAACFKIQVGIPIILYYAFLRRWRTAAAAGTIFGLASLIGILPMEAHGIHWLTELNQNARQTLGPDGVNDPLPGAPYRNDMVNLQTLLYVVIHNPGVVDAVSSGFVLAGVIWLIMLAIATPRADRNLPLISLAMVLSVLPVYHRLYDTLPLALLFVWALKRLHTRLRGYAIITLVLLCEFLIPIDFVPTMVRLMHVPAHLTQALWWQGMVVPHHAWGMLLLAAWLVYLCTALVPRQQEAGDDAAIHPSRHGAWTAWAKLSHR